MLEKLAILKNIYFAGLLSDLQISFDFCKTKKIELLSRPTKKRPVCKPLSKSPSLSTIVASPPPIIIMSGPNIFSNSS